MDHAPTPPSGLPRLIDLETLATYLGVPVATVYDWRSRRLGPPTYRIGKRLMFFASAPFHVSAGRVAALGRRASAVARLLPPRAKSAN